MSRRWAPAASGGRILQSALAKSRAPMRAQNANGLNLRGVVIAAYVYDSESDYIVSGIESSEFNEIYVEVLLYGKHNGVLPRVLWTNDLRGGLHESDMAPPRPANYDVTGEEMDTEGGTNPANMDGDHVIVSFLEDDLNQPFVSRLLQHPSSDIGNSERNVGHRMRLQEADGEPRFQKHRGTFWGVNDAGEFIIDLRRAHLGVYGADGSEPTPTIDGTSGSFKIKLPENSKLEIDITKGVQEGKDTDDDTETTKLTLENNKLILDNDGGAGVTIENKDGNAILTLGDGAISMAISETLEAMWTRFMAALEAWNGTGAAGTNFTAAGLPVLQVTPLPTESWDATIKSSKVKSPDG